MTSTDPPPTSPEGAPVIELRHTSIGYGARPVVEDVSLRIQPGEVVALVGPNGSGKTTIVRGVLGLASVVGGEVRLFGVPAGRFHERWRIGYVPQRHTVVGAVPSTVQEVVASGRLARRRWWKPSTATDRALVERAIDVVGLDDQSRASVSTLSGGQQRRVLIARALAADPEVLVMDEPTAGVDAASADALTRTLGRLVSDGRTLLIVTHDVAPLAPILTRVVAVAGGSVVGDEPAHVALSAASALAGGLYAHPGHDPHHQAPDDPAGRPGAPGWLGDPGLHRAPTAG
ncbi:MAG: metal ABC transporter ATP-binding protein [Acidimicrobiia bacterium]|nr:metal ABC transporter ATP-binding protein [Acidimicrobiia bacterium]MDH5290006.1 metal ABC transporter ATP-binding protein [Acidimicrobiia bacterium]